MVRPLSVYRHFVILIRKQVKKKGSIFENEDARNQDLMRAYRQLVRECKHIYLPDICKQLVNMPSERFWVSEERAAIVISDMLKGRSIENMTRNKREMYEEIFSRVQAVRAEHPEMSLTEVVAQVVEGPAPKFYLTPKSAKVIISKIKSEWYARRKRKYRHLFM